MYRLLRVHIGSRLQAKVMRPVAPPEPRGPEGGGGLAVSRSKSGLETPLTIRRWGETRLIFGPPAWYDYLTWACMGLGVLGYLLATMGISLILPAAITYWVGPAVALSGIWAQLSSERMTCDLRTRMWSRREGQGVFKRITRGRLDELDAVVVTVSDSAWGVAQAGRVVRTTLHWKNAAQPPLIVLRDYAESRPEVIVHNQLTQAAELSRRLQIPIYDNSHFRSDSPLKPF